MLLKILSSNIRRSCRTVPISQFCRNYNNIKRNSDVTRTVFSNGLRSCNAYYSADRPSDGRIKNKKADDELSAEDLFVLNKDPDSFGTLSLPVDSENLKTTEESQTKEDEREVTTTPALNIEEYEKLLQDLVGNKDVGKAVNVFINRVLKKDNLRVSSSIYEWLIEECIRSENLQKAFSLYINMKERGVRPSFECLEKLVVASENLSHNVKKVNDLKKLMEKYDYALNERIYNVQIRVNACPSFWQTAFALADEAKEKNYSLETETIHLLLKASCYDKEGGFQRGLGFWYELRSRRFTPNIDTISAFLKCIHQCEIGNVKSFVELVKDEQKKRESSENVDELQHSNETVDAFNDGRPNLLAEIPRLGFLVQIEKVKTPEHRLLLLGGLSQMWKEIKSTDIELTAEFCIALLNVIPSTTSAEDSLMRLLAKENFSPDFDFLTRLLTRRCMRQCFDGSLDVINMMIELDQEPGIVSYGLLSLSCKTQNEAQDFFEVIGQSDCDLNIHILSAMLKNACNSDDINFVIEIMRKMKELNIEPTEECLAMAEAFEQTVSKGLRKHTKPTKSMRNESFKFIREQKDWIKHFRLDKPHKKEAEPRSSAKGKL